MEAEQYYYQSELVFFLLTWGEVVMAALKLGCAYALWSVLAELRRWLKFLRTGFDHSGPALKRPRWRGW